MTLMALEKCEICNTQFWCVKSCAVSINFISNTPSQIFYVQILKANATVVPVMYGSY